MARSPLQYLLDNLVTKCESLTAEITNGGPKQSVHHGKESNSRC